MSDAPPEHISDFCNRVFNIAAGLDLEEGHCSKGVRLICEALCIPYTRAASAYMQRDYLPGNGWFKLAVRPEKAPVGSLLLFDKDTPAGVAAGSAHGHIEMVTRLDDGVSRYVSDRIRAHWGGSVWRNYVGAYIHPDLAHLLEGKAILAPDSIVCGTAICRGGTVRDFGGISL